MSYEDANASDWWSDPRGLEADRAFVKGLEEYIDRASQKGYKDDVTRKAPSKEAIFSARTAIWLFNKAIENKEKKLDED